MKRILIVGATSSIAEHCARLWAKEPAHFFLAARDQGKLSVIARDLKVRSPKSAIETFTPEFQKAEGIDAFIGGVFAEGALDIALIAHGALPDQVQCQQDIALVQAAIDVNAVSPILFAESIARHMEVAGGGTLAVIGSVAGDRGRQSNYVYGAAKGLVDRYMQGMRHRFAATKIRCVLIKPGPTDTPMTADLRVRGVRLAPVDKVASDIVAGIASGKAVVYTPGIWRWIMLVIRHVPEFIFVRTRL
jgi:short-subunit dehydrogenase